MSESKCAHKKVLFLIHTLGGGGAEKALVNLVNNLDRKKYDITVMTIVDVGELRYSLNNNINYKTTIRLRRKKKLSGRNLDKSGSLLNKKSYLKSSLAKIYVFIWRHAPVGLFHRIFIGKKYDIEISFLEGICTKIIGSSKNKKSKKIAWVHVDLINQKKSDAIFKNIEKEKECYKKFDRIVCVSEAVRKQFVKKFGRVISNIETKYNLIDEEEIILKSKIKNNDLHKSSKSVCLVSVGRLNRQKGYDRLLKIIKRLNEENASVVLYIIGEGTMGDELKKYISKNNLAKVVKLLGFKNNPYSYLVRGDVFVCSSRAEGFSTVVSEAIILGLPVVSVDVAGAREILGENNEYGIVTKNNEESLYCGIKKMVEDKDLRLYYSRAAKKRKLFFSIKQCVKCIEEILDE